MIKIAICDDEKIFVKKIEDIVAQYMEERQILCEIDLFYSGRDFVKLGLDMAKYQILFLDINMDGLDGIQTAQYLRNICKDTYIIFVSAYINYTLEGYKVEAIRYVLKNNPKFKEAIHESLDTVCDKMNYIPQIECFQFKEGKKEILLDRIVYIESNLHKLNFHVLEADYVIYTLYETLNLIEKRFQEYDFVRIHQSYLVNLKYIKDIVNYNVYLVDGTNLPVAKPRYKHVRECFAIFKGEI